MDWRLRLQENARRNFPNQTGTVARQCFGFSAPCCFPSFETAPLTVFRVTQHRKLVPLPALPCAKNSKEQSIVNCSRPRVSSIDRRLQCSSSV